MRTVAGVCTVAEVRTLTGRDRDSIVLVVRILAGVRTVAGRTWTEPALTEIPGVRSAGQKNWSSRRTVPTPASPATGGGAYQTPTPSFLRTGTVFPTVFTGNFLTERLLGIHQLGS